MALAHLVLNHKEIFDSQLCISFRDGVLKPLGAKLCSFLGAELCSVMLGMPWQLIFAVMNTDVRKAPVLHTYLSSNK